MRIFLIICTTKLHDFTKLQVFTMIPDTQSNTETKLLKRFSQERIFSLLSSDEEEKVFL